MTQRQEQALRFFETYKGQKGYAPTLAEVGAALGVSHQAADNLLARIGVGRSLRRARGIVTPTEIRLGGYFNYTPKQHGVLVCLKTGLKVAEIARLKAVSHSAICQLLDALAAKGAVQRFPLEVLDPAFKPAPKETVPCQ